MPGNDSRNCEPEVNAFLFIVHFSSTSFESLCSSCFYTCMKLLLQKGAHNSKSLIRLRTRGPWHGREAPRRGRWRWKVAVSPFLKELQTCGVRWKNGWDAPASFGDPHNSFLGLCGQVRKHIQKLSWVIDRQIDFNSWYPSPRIGLCSCAILTPSVWNFRTERKIKMWREEEERILKVTAVLCRLSRTHSPHQGRFRKVMLGWVCPPGSPYAKVNVDVTEFLEGVLFLQKRFFTDYLVLKNNIQLIKFTKFKN